MTNTAGAHPRRAHTVICTAGHIDHGKSSLIISLTGYNTDRLKEEQEREMTIELGFAFYRDDVTFIDVPGHEKFLKAMLAGASGVDGAVLVVAADDGIMPQTREHFEILKLLGIERGIVALTKTDLAEPDWIELVQDEIREMAEGSFLADAPILPVSNRSGEGMDAFRAALDDLIANCRPRASKGLFRMWLDRSFTLKGSGTVVAGTVLSGSVRVGDRLEILPEGVQARVKRIQVHKKDVDAAQLGERAALNLPGIATEQAPRGSLLAAPDHYRPSYMLNARLDLLPSAPTPVESRTRLRLHLGSSEHIGRIVLLEKRPIPPGGSGFVQFRLEDQAMADIGDRFVVRSFSEGRVLGGGVILEIHPPKMKLAGDDDLKRLSRLESAEPRQIVAAFLDQAGDKTSDAAAIARELAFTAEETIDVLGALERDGQVKVINGAPRWQVCSCAVFYRLLDDIPAFVGEQHRLHPNLGGVRRAEMRSQLMPGGAQALFERLLTELSESGRLELEGELVRLAGHRVTFTAQQEQLAQSIEDNFRKNLFKPQPPDQLAAELGAPQKDVEAVITGLIETGRLVRLSDPEGTTIVYNADALLKAGKLIEEFFTEHKEMRFFEFRELIGSSRKFTTPILNHFDNIGVTFREGDIRRKGSRRS